MYFVNNHFDNTLDCQAGGDKGMFMFGGSVYGPIYVRNNTFENVGGYLVNFWWGGGAEDEHGNPDHMLNKNLFFEGNTVKNIGGPVIKMEGAWGNGYFGYPEGEAAAKATGRPYITQYNEDGSIKALITYAPLPVENFIFENNHITARDENTPFLSIDAPHRTPDGEKDPQSGLHLTGVKILNNTFIGGMAPQEKGPFLGELPLFSGNTYENTAFTHQSGDNIMPLCERVSIMATEPTQAVMRTGVYAHGQEITLTGAPGTAPVTFAAGADTYDIPGGFVLTEGYALQLRYDKTKERWALT
jgi:hypothetical protein